MADRNGMVQMKASKFFTRNSPTTGQILHGDDRKEADNAARYPYVSPGDAEFLEKEGLAKPYSGSISEDGDAADDGTGLTVDERSGVMVEENIDAENSVDATTGLSTRDTTAFPQSPEAMAGAGGTGREFTATDKTSGPASEPDAPASGGESKASGSRSKSK